MLYESQHVKTHPDQPTCVHDLLGLVESRHGWVGHGHCVLPLACLHRVILFPVVVGIEKLLEPLHKLKVVLELALYQLVNRDDLRQGGDY